MKNPVIFDVDTGVDDCYAIVMAIKNRCNIQFFCSCNGNIDAKQGAKNTLDILEMIKAPQIPVLIGSEEGFVRTRKKIQVHGSNGVGDFVFPKNKRRLSKKDFIKTYINTLTKATNKIDIIVLGPITNLAKVLNKCPECAKKIGKVYFMGSSFDHPKGKKPYAGFNVGCDPEALQKVLDFNLDLTFCPNNLGREHFINPKEILVMKKINRVGNVLGLMLANYHDHFVKNGCALYDSATVFSYLKPQNTQIKNVCMELKYYDELDTAIAIPNFKKKPNAKIVTDIDDFAFKKFICLAILRCYRFNEDFIFHIEQLKEKFNQKKPK